MHTNSLIAVSGALFALAAAVPMQQHQHHKRDYFWVTEVEEVIVTVPVTETVWVSAGKAVSTDLPQYPAAPSAKITAAAANNKPYVPSSAEVVAAPVATTSQQAAPAPQPTTPVYVAPPAPETTAAPVVAPAPTTEAAAPAPAPTTSAYAPPAAPAAAAPSAASNSDSSSSKVMNAPGTTYHGEATFTDFSIGLGTCGTLNQNNEDVVAVSHVIWASVKEANPIQEANPNNSELCKQHIKIQGPGGVYTALVTDKCPGCDADHIDLPLPLWLKVTGLSQNAGHSDNITFTFM